MHQIARMALLVAALIAAPSLCAQSYPVKPVRVVAPYPPGSSADVIGRIYTPKLSEWLGRQFVVDNRPGASGNIAGELVARSAPDGYTLLILNTPIAASPLILKNVPFDAVRDFAPIGMLGLAPYLLVVNVAMPVKTVNELVAYVKARPGKLTYASTGVGGGLHLTMEMLRMYTGIEMLHVPYKGSSSTVPDMIGGRIDVMFGSAPALLPHVRAGRIRAVGISSAKRSAAAPDVPTIAESIPGFESVSFTALAAPTGTPRNVISVLNAAIGKASESPDIVRALTTQGTDPAPMSPERLAVFIREEIAKWKKVVTAAGIKGE
jgi:tripartite-type tricarboxylate transporter receptor subunit TctC